MVWQALDVIFGTFVSVSSDKLTDVARIGFHDDLRHYGYKSLRATDQFVGLFVV